MISNTQTVLPASNQAASSFSSSINPNTSAIESLIRGMSESFLAKLQESSFFFFFFFFWNSEFIVHCF